MHGYHELASYRAFVIQCSYAATSCEQPYDACPDSQQTTLTDGTWVGVPDPCTASNEGASMELVRSFNIHLHRMLCSFALCITYRLCIVANMPDMPGLTSCKAAHTSHC